MDALLDTIIKHVPPPKVDVSAPFRFQVTSLDYNSFIGGIAIGRIQRGSVSVGQVEQTIFKEKFVVDRTIFLVLRRSPLFDRIQKRHALGKLPRS